MASVLGLFLALALALALFLFLQSTPLALDVPQPSMVSPADFRATLSSPQSHSYFDGMGDADLRGRGCRDAWEVRARIQESQMEASDPWRERLVDLAHRADSLCMDHPSTILAALPSLPWRFAVLRDDVEGGMPHTHGRVICLPARFFNEQDDRACLRTLIHEKVHVCQRARPDLSEAAVEEDGYVRVCRRSELSPAIQTQLRSNPDLDPWVYQSREAAPTVFLLSEHPSSLGREEGRPQRASGGRRI